jgi:hypothetical protein
MSPTANSFLAQDSWRSLSNRLSFFSSARLSQGAGLMLKARLSHELRELIILMVFIGLMQSVLTLQTIGFAILGGILVWFKKRPPPRLRNALAVIIFGSYWFTYGKMIDPEIGLNFLTTIIVLKLLEEESERDRYMIFFGLLLLISAGSLFEKSLTYVLFFSLSFFLLIQDFYSHLRLNFRLKDWAKVTLWILPLSGFLFFFAPRMLNPIPLEKGSPHEGEVGYTPEVLISQIKNLSFNNRPVFQAIVSHPLSSEKLYWRGNTLAFTDGWNWPFLTQDKPILNFSKETIPPLKGFTQEIKLYDEQEFFFTLDHPNLIKTPKGIVKLDDRKSLGQRRWQWVPKYEVSSSINARYSAFEDRTSKYLQHSFKKSELDWVNKTFSNNDLPLLRKEVEKYFHDKEFSYSLSPGKVPNFLQFMRQKKIGFCAHYASAVALIFRVKGIPTRLVSGFLGGTYNKFADFYLIGQNDAHVWVEALYHNQWIRLDPTEWIAPDRVKLGGEAYMELVGSQNAGALKVFRMNFPWVNDFKQWLGQWDFRFYQWLEEMDYYGQKALLSRLKLKKEWLFTAIPLVLACFMLVYTWHLARERRKHPRSEEALLWKTFQVHLRRRGHILPLYNLKETRELLIKVEDPDKERMIQVLDKLVALSFEERTKTSTEELKRDLQNL